jgi:hypothetical protein
LRALLLLTAVVAVLLAWYAGSAERQRRAVAAIRELGGSVEIEPWGPSWISASVGDYFGDVVRVELPGHLADEVPWRDCPRLRHVKMVYNVVWCDYESRSWTAAQKAYTPDYGQTLLNALDEQDRYTKLQDQLADVRVELCEVLEYFDLGDVKAGPLMTVYPTPPRRKKDPR